MANRVHIVKAGEAGDKPDPTVISRLLSSARSQSKDKNDDLIVTLSDAYENRRARQVGEWERLYGHNVYRAL